MSFLNAIITYFEKANNIITAITVCYTVISVIIKGVKMVKNWMREKALKKLLGSRRVAIHIPTRISEKEIGEVRIKPVVAMEDYNTAEKVRDVLVKNRFNPRIKYIPPDGEIEFEGDEANLVICGPKNSPVVKRAFDSFSYLNFKKDKRGWFFRYSKSSEKLYSPIEKNTEQYAFLGKVSLSNHQCLLICGIHAIGSDGVAFFLSDRKKLDMLLKQVGKSKFYCIIRSEYGKNDKQIYNAYLTDVVNKLD